MNKKQVLSVAMILIWQTESMASSVLACKYFFAESPKVAAHEVETLIHEIGKVEQLEGTLIGKMQTLLETAVFETANQVARSLEMSIKFNLWQKATATVQQARVEMQSAYNQLKHHEPRLLYLRNVEQIGTISNVERAELVNLEAQRRAHLAYIGINLPGYKRIMHVLEREIREGKEAEKQLSSADKAAIADAQVMLKSLKVPALEPSIPTTSVPDSTTPQSQSMQGQLAEFVLKSTRLQAKYSSLTNANKIMDPSVEQLEAIASGKDKNLAQNEKMWPRKAKAQHDLELQEKTAREIKNIERILDNEAAFAFFVEKLMKIAPNNWAKTLGSSVREFMDASRKDTQTSLPTQLAGLTDVRNALRDTKALLAHYSGISKLMDVYLTPQQRYALLRELISHFNPPIDGVPPFLITLARRSDAFDILADIKKYVKENHPNEIMGKTTTMLDLISKAETYRELGLLPSVFNPKDIVTQQRAKALRAAGLTGISAVLFAVVYQYMTSDDKEKGTAPAGPVSTAPGAPARPTIPTSAPSEATRPTTPSTSSSSFPSTPARPSTAPVSNEAVKPTVPSTPLPPPPTAASFPKLGSGAQQ